MRGKGLRQWRGGQSMIELILAVGLIVLVLGGVVALMLGSLGARTAGFDRKKASQLAGIVMENLVEEKENNPETFWQLNSEINETMTGFDGYVYSVSFENVVNGLGCGDDLGVGVTDCAQVTLAVGWSGSRDQSLQFNRFFAK